MEEVQSIYIYNSTDFDSGNLVLSFDQANTSKLTLTYFNCFEKKI